MTPIGNVSDSLGLVVSASVLITSLARYVRVAILGHGHVCLVPLPGIPVPATRATPVARYGFYGAVDELLFTHDNLVISGNDPVGLGGLSGGESPA